MQLFSELHTYSVRNRISPAPTYFQNANELNQSECLWFGCGQMDAVGSQAYPGMPWCVLAFLHLRQPSSLLHSGEKRISDSIVKQ